MTSAWASLGQALSPVEDRPRVARGIESACYRTRTGAAYVVVHNPSARTYARLDPREFDLLSLMDGQHSVKELVIAYYQRYGVLALARVAGLVRLLSQQRLLVEPPVDAYARLSAKLRGGIRRAPSSALTSQHFDAVLGRAYRAWGHVFFTRPWLFVGLALGIVGPLLVFVELARGRYVLYDIGGSVLLTIVLLVILSLLALAIH